MIRRPPRSTQSRSSAASDVYKRQAFYPETLPLICRTFRRQCRETFRISELDPTGFGLARSGPDAPRLRPLNAAQSSIILLQSRLSPSGEERWKSQDREAQASTISPLLPASEWPPSSPEEDAYSWSARADRTERIGSSRVGASNGERPWPRRQRER